MARMSIDDFFLRDPRIIRLSKRLGHQDPDLTRGKLLHVYANCYDRMTSVISRDDVEVVCEGLTDGMIACDLARETPDGIRISGASDRIEYLTRQAEFGRIGGVRSSQLRQDKRKEQTKIQGSLKGRVKAASRVTSRQPQGSGQGSLKPSPDTAPDPVPDFAPDPVPDLSLQIPSPTSPDIETHVLTRKKSEPRQRRPMRPLPGDWTPRPLETDLAKSLRLELSVQSESFRDHALANDRRCADWDAAFRNWLRKADEYGRSGKGPRPPPRGPVAVMMEELRIIQERERNKP